MALVPFDPNGVIADSSTDVNSGDTSSNVLVPFRPDATITNKSTTTAPIPKLEVNSDRGFFQKIKDAIKGESMPTKRIAEAQNYMAVSKATNLPIGKVQKNWEELTAGFRDQPTNKEVLKAGLDVALIGGLISNPVATLTGVAGFGLLNEAKNYAITKAKSESYKPMVERSFSEFMSDDTPKEFKDAVDLLEFIGVAALTHKSTKSLSNSNWWRMLSNKERGMLVLETAKANPKGGDLSLGQQIRAKIKAKGGVETKAGAKYMQTMQDTFVRNPDSVPKDISNESEMRVSNVFKKGKDSYHELVAEDVTFQKELVDVTPENVPKATQNIFNNLSEAEQQRLIKKHAEIVGYDVSPPKKVRLKSSKLKSTEPIDVQLNLQEADPANLSDIQEEGVSKLAQEIIADRDINKPIDPKAMEMKPQTEIPIDEQITAADVEQLKFLGIKFEVENKYKKSVAKARNPQEKRALRIWNNFINKESLLDADIPATNFERDLTQQSSKTVFDLFGDFDSFLKEINPGEGPIDRATSKSAKREAVRNIVNELQLVSRDAIENEMSIADYLIKTERATPEQAKIVDNYISQILVPDSDGIFTRGMDLKPIEADTTGVKKMFDASRQRMEDLKKKSLIEHLKDMQTWITARDIKVSDVLKQNPEITARNAYLQKINVSGANPAAAMYYDKIYKRTYGLLKKNEIPIVDELIFARKEMDIARRNPSHKLPEGVNHPAEYETYVRNIQKERGISDERYPVIMQVVNTVFDTMKDMLQKKTNEGAISTELRNLLMKYEYSPTQWLEALDLYGRYMREGNLSNKSRPIASIADLQALVGDESIPRAGSLQNKTSGIYKLGKGSGGLQNLDSQELLTGVVNEGYQWIFKNRASRALGEFAKVEGYNGDVVRQARISSWGVDTQGNLVPNYYKPPKGFREINYFEDGQRKALWAKADFAEQWDTGNNEINNTLLNVIRHVSGTSAVKNMATGIGHPLFGISKGIFMDIPYSWIVAQKHAEAGNLVSLYPKNPIKFVTEMLKNISTVADDVIYRKGQFLDMIEQGGLFGISSTGGSLKAHTYNPTTHAFHYINEYGNYINATAEYMIRMANRKAYIDAGYTPEQATAMMRDVLDFSQGGKGTKILDNMFPFLNVGVLAARNVGRALINDFKSGSTDAIMKFAYVGAISSMLYMMNKYIHPEAIEQESDVNKDNNFIIPSGQYVTDYNGNKRWINFKIKKDTTLSFPATLGEMLTAVAFGDRVEFDRLAKSMARSVFPTNEIPKMPLYNMITSYAYNKNPFTEEDIWKGLPAGTEEWSPAVTSKLWYDLSKILRTSPDKFKVAMEQILTRQALPQRIVENSYDKLFNNVPRLDQEGMLAQFLISNWRPDVISLTMPANEFKKEGRELNEEENAKKQLHTTMMNAYLNKLYRKDQTIEDKRDSVDAIKNIIKNTDNVFERERLLRMNEDYALTAKFPNQNEWLELGTYNNMEVRGKMVARYRFLKRSLEERKQVDAKMAFLSENGSGIVPGPDNEEFWAAYGREFKRLKEDDRRMNE